ncbi:MAG TPA: hypothetical protein VLU46_04750, partial [Thermoanaerobaculia bacterium]|nr:hypothetical protein [Thermoanaerobaculia bacterium]
VAAIGFASMRSRRLAVALLAIAIVWQLYGLNFLRAKSMAAVEAAQMLGADLQVTTVAMSQLWAYGDRLYFTDRMNVVDLGTPPDLRRLGHPDAVCLYESDLTPETIATLERAAYTRKARFAYAAAREVVVFSPSSSGISDRARR